MTNVYQGMMKVALAEFIAHDLGKWDEYFGETELGLIIGGEVVKITDFEFDRVKKYVVAALEKYGVVIGDAPLVSHDDAAKLLEAHINANERQGQSSDHAI